MRRHSAEEMAIGFSQKDVLFRPSAARMVYSQCMLLGECDVDGLNRGVCRGGDRRSHRCRWKLCGDVVRVRRTGPPFLRGMAGPPDL